ncbi:carboxypeptidase regulatory-like domain-containing protein [Corallococcus sp. bb12-1]|uniref:carboxypeptidase regulatory-like domain-containing protein n=1 Tax=Corallococcus sp. bb12-1 TaxID=2996784 RepID=UPI00227005BB|nr:carboxypeptidase regulatory-like domain-containing protein [Corallococcus sp. bb12-1]MCY1045648.1 carboxypeptidase regulatory-like domain-containing protein [Corallococcus sp. bb12-1]
MRTNRWGALVALMVAVIVVQGCGGDDKDEDTAGITGTVMGTVTLDDGTSPEGVEIEYLDTDATVLADAQGRFTFKSVRAGTRTLLAVHPGYEVQQVEVAVTAGQTTDVAIALKRLKYKVSGTIQLEGASSHEGITVTLDDTAFSTTTDAQGRFAFEGLPSDAYFLVATKEGFEERTKVLAVTEDTVVETFILPAIVDPSLDGIVFMSDEASPVGVAVTLEGTAYSTTVDNDSGYFRFLNIPDGTYTMVVSKAGYVTQTRAVAAGAEVTTFSFFLELAPAP